jgi:uridine kinase
MSDWIIQHCLERILAQPHNPCLVAITGESGSGKSYFIKALRQELETKGVEYTFLNHDDFLIPRKKREALRKHIYDDGEFQGRTHWEILENWYDYDAYEVALEKLRSNQPATYHPYIHGPGELSVEAKTVMPNRIVLIEDKILLHKMDYVIELVVDRKRIIDRKIDRDSDVRTPEQTIEMHEKAQGYFWDRQQPIKSNLSIDNNDYYNPEIIRDE